MTADRWRQVEDLCHEALARAPEDRAAFLAKACSGDGELRREVESLLAHDPKAAGFMSGPAAFVASDILEHADGRLVGRRLGSYEVRSLLGVGGMGEVYRAHDHTLAREVAIKVLSSAFTADAPRRARLEREARLLASLNHPNICAIYGLADADGVRFLVLELVEGETLADRLHSRGAGLPLREVLTIAHQITDALEMAHEKGIVHRDLKPANITITADGVVKVLDFGMAKAIVAERTSSEVTPAAVVAGAETRDGVFMGTAAYMSPEQARGLSVDKRTDIWAFGCVLYEMLTGHAAFARETISDTIVKILEHEPDWSALPETTPEPIRRLLLRCLAKDPKRRLRDIGDVGIEIDAIDEVLPERSAPTASTKTRTTWLPWIAVTALAAAVVVWEIQRTTDTPDNPMADARFTRFTDWEGTEGGAAISPDGRFVAFIADRDGEFDLWLSQVGTGEFRNLTANMPSLGAPHRLLRSVGFSGDGADIWFAVSADPVLSRKMVIPLAGGTPRALLGEGDATPSWSADGARLAYFKNATPTDLLFVADRTGGDASQVRIDASDQSGWSRGTQRTHNHNPIWSADGQWLYFVHGWQRTLNWTDEMDVWRVRPAGGTPERLTTQNTAVTFLTPLDARTLLYVAHAEDGAGPWLWALDPESRITRRVSSGLEQYTSVAASRDGRRVVATLVSPTADLWTVPILDRPAENRDVQPYRVPTVRALAPRFSGRSLFCLSSRGSADGLWRFQDGQAFEVRKGADGAMFDPPAVSRDGSRVAVVLANRNRRRLAIMSADGTGLRGVAESIDIQGTADWSPDDEWIVTGGNEREQGQGLFKVSVNGGAPIRLVSGPAANPVWSPDGSLIVYAGALATGQEAPLLGVRPDGVPVELPTLRVRPGGHRFLPNGRGLVYLPRSDSLDFWVVDFATKKARQLTRLSGQGRSGRFDITPGFDITPDGKQIVFDRSRENADIVLIDLAKP
jgi:serine/threonine protein kinase/Tol biopolymer transport system component